MAKTETGPSLTEVLNHHGIDSFILPPVQLLDYPTSTFRGWGMSGIIRDLFPDSADQQMLVDGWYANQKARITERPRPSEEDKFFPGSKLIGYGWERAVYTVPDIPGRVIKVPLSEHVNSNLYQLSSFRAYDLCNNYIDPYTADTIFYFNVNNRVHIDQEALPIENKVYYFDPLTAPDDLKVHFKNLGEGFLSMLDDEAWMPDIQLDKTDDGKWSMESITVNEAGRPKVYEFSAFFDEFRISPELTAVNVAKAKDTWKAFTEELVA